ncbi:MAG: DUF6125 family protein [Promethearchaeota archaeon]
MREVSKDDKLFFFERNFFTLDGLWIIEVENQTNWDLALKIDTVVWQKLYKKIFSRVKRYLNIHTNTIKDLIDIFSFCWSCEGYNYEIDDISENKAIMKITKCPYIEAMKRNPERKDKIKDICLKMCIPFYEPALEEFNSKIKMKRTKFLGLGDDCCDFLFKLESI